jgi:hypothetical protein
MNSYGSMCDANGYGEFGNCSTLKYVTLCHYSRRWQLLTLSLKIQARILCVFTTNNTNYLGCDYMVYHFMGMGGATCQNVVFGGRKWSNVEGSHA